MSPQRVLGKPYDLVVTKSCHKDTLLNGYSSKMQDC